MRKPKLVVYEIRYQGARVWAMKEPGGRFCMRSAFAEPKSQFVSRCAARCREWANRGFHGSLRICRLDGTFIEERTYPRSADPKRSKG